MFRHPSKCDTEALRKKVEAAMTFLVGLVIIRNSLQPIKRNRDAGEGNIVREDPLCGPVDGHYFHLEHAAIVR